MEVKRLVATPEALTIIEKLKKAQFESGEIRSYDEKYQALLFLALLLGLIDLWLGDRKAPGRLWQGRFEVARD